MIRWLCAIGVFFFSCDVFALTEYETRAMQATEKMLRLKKKLGIDPHDLYKIARYIETTLKPTLERANGDTNLYIRKEVTGLKRTIEYCRDGRHIFIHLKTHGIDLIGRGGSKVVSLSIRYDSRAPELVANCVIVDSNDKEREQRIKSEINALRVLAACPAIAHLFSVSKHTKRDGTKVCSMLLRYYSGGSLKNYFVKKSFFSEAELKTLSFGYLSGLRAMHAVNLIHGDISLRNLVLDSAKGQFSGVLIDFGRTCSKREMLQQARIQAAPRNNPPEVFVLDPAFLDPKAADLYAMGLCLYRMYYKKEPEWTRAQTEFTQAINMKGAERASFGKNLAVQIAHTLAQRRNEKQHSAFAEIILSLCDPNPAKRPSAATLCEQLR